MNRNMNMLSAKKVKLHGMTSARWTTADKLSQYKGLISLYNRDRKIVEVDTQVFGRKLHRQLQSLQRTVNNDRKQLDNAIRGDKQQLRNTLADHRDFQLAYQNTAPKKVIDNIDQINFRKRKEQDRLQYQLKLKADELIKLRLERALLEDRLKYHMLGKIQQEEKAQIITGKVQEALLRKEGAIGIRQSYEKMIQIMKKDALYFDAILATIYEDGVEQNNCFLNAATLGQLATEYLDDRRQEYNSLEKVALKAMANRKLHLKTLQEQSHSAAASLKELLRRDSDFTTCSVKKEESNSLTDLRNDLYTVEKTLEFLQSSTNVPTLEAIYPCFQDQVKQKERLKNLADKCERDNDIILNKLNHAELMKNILKNSMGDSTKSYMDRKKEVFTIIEQLSESCEKNGRLVKYRRNLIAKIRLGLDQLQQLCKPIGVKAHIKNVAAISNVPVPATCDEIDGCKILPDLIVKLTKLMTQFHERKIVGHIETAYKTFENTIKDRGTMDIDWGKNFSTESLLQGTFTEVSYTLTREDIKRISANIVTANIKTDI